VLILLLSAFALGFVFNATPGPVFAETIRRGVNGGFRSAFAVQVGSLVGDAVWALVGLIGIGLLLRLDWLRTPIVAVSTIYLTSLAWGAWQAGQRPAAIPAEPGRTNHRHALRSGVLLALTNPQNVGYWAAIGSAVGSITAKGPSLSNNVVFFVGFMISSAVWACLAAALVDRVFRHAGAGWAQLTHRACAVAFLVLAVSTLRQLWPHL
jgi:chemosensory pili system protein ChpE/L-lysine exporter family protein LysE/ArgO